VTAMTDRRPALQSPTPREAADLGHKVARGVYGARVVGSFLPRLTAKAFERYGFSTASLITDWPAIIGTELAAHTAPERLKWPRGAQPFGEDDKAEERRRQGATLVLRVDGARALDVQYKARQLIERINAYFGFAAVAELRLVQAPVSSEPRQKCQANRSIASPLTAEVQGISDAALRDALARLGAGVRAGR